MQVQPVETLPKGLPIEGPRGCVVPTCPTMYVGEQLSSFFDWDVFLLDP
jgi:hypothetical protein